MLVQEPILHDHPAGEPAIGEQPGGRGADPGRREQAQEPVFGRLAESLSDLRFIGRQVGRSVLTIGRGNYLGRHQAGFDRRANAFAAHGVSETRRVADQ